MCRNLTTQVSLSLPPGASLEKLLVFFHNRLEDADHIQGGGEIRLQPAILQHEAFNLCVCLSCRK
jgi:hypothetical protein